MNLIYRLLGLGKVWDAINGKKTAIGAASLVLAGVGMICAGLAGILGEIQAAKDLHELAQLLQHLATDSNFQMVVAGKVSLGAGLSALGIGHKIEKQTQATKQLAAAPAPSSQPQEDPQ